MGTQTRNIFPKPLLKTSVPLTIQPVVSGTTSGLVSFKKIMQQHTIPEIIPLPRDSGEQPAQKERAEQILRSLITQTSQAEYDDEMVDKLINEYQRLVPL